MGPRNCRFDTPSLRVPENALLDLLFSLNSLAYSRQMGKPERSKDVAKHQVQSKSSEGN